MLWRATQGVAEGRMTLGDLVMINAFMIQLYIPLNFLGVMYREIKQALTDLDKMFTLLQREREVADAPQRAGAAGARRATCASSNVSFAYEPDRPILQGVSFDDPAGPHGGGGRASGPARSTLARLLYRFYDVHRRLASPSTARTCAT
jgi:ATP-binding cassette subfamily B protein